MRILPHYWEGSHPAFPHDTLPYESCYPFRGVATYGLYGGMVGLLAGASRGSIRVTGRWGILGSSLRWATYGVTARIVYLSVRKIKERDYALQYLRLRHVSPPEVCYLDRIHHWDEDNWRIWRRRWRLCFVLGRMLRRGARVVEAKSKTMVCFSDRERSADHVYLGVPL